jgi:antitoxin component YwqK of YwqJK toxin-antitoxin module
MPGHVNSMLKRILHTFLFISILAGCENETALIAGDTLIEQDGIYYEQESKLPFTGRAEWFHDNDQLMTYIYYIDGKRNGVNEDFFEDGRLSERSTYIDGKRNGLHEEYYPNGQLMERRHYVYGKGNGLWERYSEDGNLLTSDYYKDGTVIPAHSDQ